MSSELTNLLPRDRVRILRTEYFFRLATVAVLGLVGLVIVCGVLLFPSYLFLGIQVSSRSAEIANLGNASKNADQASAAARLTALADDTTYLATLAKKPNVSKTIKNVLAVPHPGITLSGFTFAPPKGSTNGTMTVSGTSATRDALRSYSLALRSVPTVDSADLPVSAYAKDSNIPFTVTLTGTFTP
jgi:hypothetical protein